MKTYTQFEGIAGCFGYDAVETTVRRKAPTINLRSEDEILRWHDRDKLVSTARDAKRNYAVAAWMIRKHLDFVSDFTFQPTTHDDVFNARLIELMDDWKTRHNAHVQRRHPLRRMMRIIEACRVIDGDILVEKMRLGSLNMVRGDRIRNPFGRSNTDEWKHGVRVNRYGADVAYQIHRRTRDGRFVRDKVVSANNAILHGYFDDCDQVRGVSPLSVAINSLRDTYEGIDFALARLKVEQILGFAVTKKAVDGATNPYAGNQQFEADDEDAEEVAEEESRSGKVDYGTGIWQWELDEGEDIKTVAGNMPGSNAQTFLDTCIHLALKALDLPISFWNEAVTNFFGSRGALQLYRRSASNKQADNQELLGELTKWKIVQWIIEGQLDLPRGWTLQDVSWLWVPRGIPWWDRSKEIRGDILAIGAALDNPIDVCQDHGLNTPQENIDKLAKVLEYGEKKLSRFGVRLDYGITQIEDDSDTSKESEGAEKE